MSVHIDVADVLRKARSATGTTESHHKPVTTQPLHQAAATGVTGATTDALGAEHGIPKPHATAARERAALRCGLAALADHLNIATDRLERIDDEWLALLVRMPTDSLPTFLLALHDMATRHAGEVPADDTAVICCAGCGPVYAHPTTAAVLPVVDGWPRALGCPWCAIRKTGGQVPRPNIDCTGCARFISTPRAAP